VSAATADGLWPRLDEPGDLPALEAVPLAERGLPASTWALLDRAASLWPERTAITVLPSVAAWDEPVTVTFAGLRDRVGRTAAVLHGLEVRRTDAVGVISPNTAGMLCAVLAAQAAGVVAPINPALAEDVIVHLVATTGARVLVVAGPDLDERVWATITRLVPGSAVHTVLVLRPDTAAGPAPRVPGLPGVQVLDLAESTAAEDIAELSDLPEATDAAAYFHTGGTTGAPKIAVHTHANEVTMAWSMAAVQRATDPDDSVSAIFAALPLFHVNALLVTCLAPLMTGRPVVWGPPGGYREPGLHPTFWRIVERYRIGGMSAVPTVYASLTRVPVDADISSLRMPVVGAAPLPDAVRTAFSAHTGVELVEGYGLTEATCATAMTRPGRARPGSVGQRLPYQQVKAVALDPVTGEWTDLPPGETGLLVISGPTVFAGYLRDGRPIRDGVVRDGWLDTGDRGSVDADGFLRLAGRTKDLIIRGGHNIDPAVVEEALLRHPGVLAAAAVGRPDRYAGEVPVAYVVCDPQAAVSAEDLREWAAGAVPEPAAAPKEVVLVDALPLTEVGKVFKPALRADAARRLIAAELGRLGGRARVVPGSGPGSIGVVAPDDQVDRVRDVLGGYALDWHLVENGT
jgi:fatty-acyl-CoA synthase